MNSLDAKVSALGGLSLPELRNRWLDCHSMAAPQHISPQLLRLAVAYKIQEAQLGGLSRSSALRLKNWNPAKAKEQIRRPRLVSNAAPKPGTKFIREWQGMAHEVLALEDGDFTYAGKTYRSLTTVVRLITGTHQSGPRFFGLAGGNNGQ